MGKSKIYRLEGKLFRYDFDSAMVEWVTKADEEMLKDNEEWQAKYGKDLWDIDSDGYMVMASAGLSPENWKNRGLRREYIFQWIVDLDEESRALARNFEKYELPYLNKAAGEEELK